MAYFKTLVRLGQAPARRAVTSFRISPERLAAAQALQAEGVPVTAGQLTGNRALRFREAELGGKKAADLMEKQQEAFTSAVLKRAGIDAPKATPEIMDQAFKNVGKKFDDLAANSSLAPDKKLISDLRGVFDNYGETVAETMRAPIVQNITGDIVGALQRGPLSGKAYQNTVSRLAKTARETSNSDLRSALYGLREALDDGMERSIAKSNPEQAGVWREAREQYRNLLAIEQSATRAGEAAAEGIISPANIRNAAVNQGRRAYARGKGDFADLARSGSMLLSPLPDSGTAGRLHAKNLGASLTSVLGAGAGGAVGGGFGAMAGLAAGAAVPRIAGAALMSRPGQAYLRNQLAAAPRLPIGSGYLNGALTVPASQNAGDLYRKLLAQ